jgi:hypothetical protein
MQRWHLIFKRALLPSIALCLACQAARNLSARCDFHPNQIAGPRQPLPAGWPCALPIYRAMIFAMILVTGSSGGAGGLQDFSLSSHNWAANTSLASAASL